MVGLLIKGIGFVFLFLFIVGVVTVPIIWINWFAGQFDDPMEGLDEFKEKD